MHIRGLAASILLAGCASVPDPGVPPIPTKAQDRACIRVAPDTLDFGHVAVATTPSVDRRVTIQSDCIDPVVIEGITVEGDGVAVQDMSLVTLDGYGAFAEPVVTFTPRAPGQMEGRLTVHTSAGQASARLLGLGLMPELTVSTDRARFPVAPVGCPTTITATLANTGNATLTGLTGALAGSGHIRLDPQDAERLAAGDVDGDGKDDVLFSLGNSSEGEVVLLANAMWSGTYDWGDEISGSIEGGEYNQAFGFGMPTVMRDVNNDGATDLVVGDWKYDDSGGGGATPNVIGAVHIFHNSL